MTYHKQAVPDKRVRSGRYGKTKVPYQWEFVLVMNKYLDPSGVMGSRHVFVLLYV